MLFIYTPHINPRIHYAVEHLFGSFLNIPYELTEKNEFSDGEQVISYGNKADGTGAFLAAHPLMSEDNVRKQDIRVSEYNGHKVFFEVEDPESGLPYDPFAMIFYLLSRYEEYLDHKKDIHGRFPARESLAFRENFLHIPLADIVMRETGNWIEEQFPGIRRKETPTSSSVSYDIDAPFAFYGKPFYRTFGGAARSVLSGNFGQAAYRLKVAGGSAADPYDTFEQIGSELEKCGIGADFYLLLEKGGRNNPMIDWQDQAYKKVIGKLAGKYPLGLHPSYSCNYINQLEKEMNRFKVLTGSLPVHSRQHFLRLSLPDTYRLLEEAGITDDHSMAFPDMPGFRAGTARPFMFFDLPAERKTSLRIHPFPLMDATFEYYLALKNEEEIMRETARITAGAAGAGGPVHMVFHNDIISGYKRKFDWTKLHRDILKALSGA